MDGLGFDRFARLLGSGLSRRQMLRALAAGSGVATVGLGSTSPDALAATKAAKPKVSGSPHVTFDGFNAIVSVQFTQAAQCVIDYGTKKSFDLQVTSDGQSRTHQLVLPNLTPQTRYYYRIHLLTDSANALSRVYTFQTPSCPHGTKLCGGGCIQCGNHAALDTMTCACACKTGYGDCDGDPANGCETRVNTVDNCLACGNSCADGNACTDNTCDPSAGCVTANVADGTACGTNGVCAGGTCQSCVAAGNCDADTHCCDDEVCCSGTCVAKSALLTDVANCGACGNVCADAPCQVAICVNGACQTEPGPDDETCDDGNPCTENDGCMSGMCMGNPVADGTLCGDAGTCQKGTCVTCTPGNTCSASTDCCADESCCNGHCVATSSFETDPVNCGACGHGCDGGDICQQVACKKGVCSSQPAPDGDPCAITNPCLKHTICSNGECTGDLVEDGTVCGTEGTCQQGKCVEAEIIGAIFTDDFELGDFSKWSLADGIKLQSTIVAEGTYAARATGNSTVAYARKSLSPAQADLALRTRFQLMSQGDNSVYLLRAYTSASAPLVTACVTSSGKLATLNHTTGETKISATAIAIGTWYELQVRLTLRGAGSTIEVMLNGVKVDDLSNAVNLGTTAVTLIQIGDNVDRRTFDVVFDDVAACAGELCSSLGPIAPPVNDGTSTAPGASSGVLLETYTHNSSKGAGVNWSYVVYRPRQFKSGLIIGDPTRGDLKVDDPGTYAGWDVLSTFNASVHRIETAPNWTVLELNRDATLGIVWRGGKTIPTWISNGWAKAENVVVGGNSFPTFRKSFGAGTVTLGAVYDATDTASNGTRDTYWVLFAERDSLRSPAPATPSGRDTPVPNATCPQWLHDRHAVTGPDGKTYPTWHALIDPVYWCYYRHDHGTNPAHFSEAKMPAFGYTADKHGMSEAHAGFKNYVFDSIDSTRWMVTHHFGTAGLARACNRFHTVDVAVRSIVSGELLVDLHFMGDFGKSVVNRTQEIITPPTCPDQGAQATGSSGIRMLPAQSADAVGYEPWRVDLKKTIFGFIGDFTFNNPDPMVICNTAICDQPVTTGNSGTKRFFTPNRSGNGAIFGLTASPSASGQFYTDPLGTKILNAGDPGATMQYIKPGINIVFTFNGSTGHCYDIDAWGKQYVCGVSDGNPTDREGSVKAPN